MANELKHGSVGTELTQAEWEAVGTHVVANQAVGDIIYADTTSQLLRLGVGSTNDVLRVTGGKPDWQATSFITTLGTIATGVWQGTDVGVAYGGTGASTLTDGGVLLGSGTGAVTAMAVLTDSQMIVGNGSTDPVAESGSTLRTSIGVGTGDSPSFTALTLDGDLGFTGPQAITTTSGELTLNAAGFGVIVPDGDGLVIGHTARISVVQTDGAELQVLGTSYEDSSILLGRWGNNDYGPSVTFFKSKGGSISESRAAVDDDVTLGRLLYIADDGTDFDTTVAMFDCEVDDASVEAGGIGTAFVWKQMPGGGTTAVQETMRLDASGILYIGDDANTQMTTGLTINQGAADNQILAFKSSDITTGLGTLATPDVETDDWLVIAKENPTLGGAKFTVLAEDAASTQVLVFRVYGGTADTGKTTSASASMLFFLQEHDGSNGNADVTANGNVFGVKARVGGANVMRFMVDEDGDMYSVTSAQTFDEFDDAQMVRALDQAKGDVVRGRWDDYVAYNEQALIDIGVLGGPIREGGMTNVTQLQRLHNGAIWQGYVRQQEMQEHIDTLESRFLAIEGAK